MRVYIKNREYKITFNWPFIITIVVITFFVGWFLGK